ncbi:WSC domain protein [Aspergillus sclerotialis]|uniref:WSC domain protein n=1 Tax=Aspergillus sclerotialis TaxID=2070753 RepID=A0A3A2ZVU0_9EURO|nr:WSC domain protein [Aspergillus sclerotialis]
MKSSNMRSALAVSLLFASGLPAVVKAASEFEGCYSSATGLDYKTKYTYQSSGWCQDHCKERGNKVFGLNNGSTCLCGDELPSESDKVSKDQCNVSCDGFPQDMCGGKDTYSIYLVDASDKPSVASGSTTGSSTSTTNTDGASATNAPVTTTKPGGETIVVTQAPESQDSSSAGADTKKDSSKSNTAAIAAGVVVGVVGFFALIGAAFFFYRFKKRKGQPNYLNNGPVDHYAKPMSTSSNSRFDGDFMAQRRQSNGSIDDDQDFSRRILQVG